MGPVVAKVVEVGELAPFTFEEIFEEGLVVPAIIVFRVGADAFDEAATLEFLESVEVVVVPVEEILNGMVKVVKGGTGADAETSPNGWVGSFEVR